MGSSSKLVDLLKSNLDAVEEPTNYRRLRSRLSSIRPNRRASTVKESPENAIQIDKLLTGDYKTDKPLS